jgi:nucleotide-binding universal stress UspA family protein
MKTILAPIDFSSVTDAVVAQAISLGRAVSARVVLLTVIQPPAVVAEYAPLLQDIAEITIAGEKAAAVRNRAVGRSANRAYSFRGQANRGRLHHHGFARAYRAVRPFRRQHDARCAQPGRLSGGRHSRRANESGIEAKERAGPRRLKFG